MSKENAPLVIAESWEDADADPVKELMEKVEKVKLHQRNEEKKEAYFEKVKAEEHAAPPIKLQVGDGLGPSAEEPKRVFLRRPKDGFSAESVVESSPASTTSAETESTPRGRSHHKSHHKESKQPAQTFEERQAAYQAARNRIMGSEYKPDNQEIKEIKFIDRSKSPETLKMTQQNLVEHYGEELSRELMHQPEMPTEAKFLPDFSQPPPSMNQPDNVPIYNGPPGFPQRPPGFQQNYQLPHMLENQYYLQNGQMPMQYQVHSQMQQFVPQDPSAATSGPPNSYVEGQNEQAFYYCQPPQQQMFQNYIQNKLPNMSFPPPNFQSQGQPHQPMMNQMNHPQMLQMQQQQQANGQVTHLQLKNGVGRGNNSGNRGAANVQCTGRGQNRQPMMYSGNSGGPTNVSGGMYSTQIRPNNSQGYPTRNEGQRSMNQQNDQFNQAANSMSNGRKQSNKNLKPGPNMQKTNSNTGQQQIPLGQNPVPFGCPPRHVNAMREQQANSMLPNSGAGILGPHPMAPNQWPSLQ